MAARKKSAKKKSTRKKAAKKKASMGATIDRELRDLAKRMEQEIKKLERTIDAAQVQAGREAAKLIHQARMGLARADIRGSAEWQKFLRRSQSDLVKALGRLEKAVKPSSRRRKAAGKKKAARKAATRKKATRKKAARAT
jgi:hypothetical protein